MLQVGTRHCSELSVRSCLLRLPTPTGSLSHNQMPALLLYALAIRACTGRGYSRAVSPERCCQTGCASILARSPLRPPSGVLPVSSAPTSTSRSQRGADTTPSCKRITPASRTAERSFLELVRHRHHPRLPPRCGACSRSFAVLPTPMPGLSASTRSTSTYVLYILNPARRRGCGQCLALGASTIIRGQPSPKLSR